MHWLLDRSIDRSHPFINSFICYLGAEAVHGITVSHCPETPDGTAFPLPTLRPFPSGSHSTTCHPTQVNTTSLYSSQIGWYSIYLVEPLNLVIIHIVHHLRSDIFEMCSHKYVILRRLSYGTKTDDLESM